MTIERLDADVSLPLDLPAILSGDPEQLSAYLTELINELQQSRIHDIHQRVNLLLDLSSGSVVYLGTKNEAGSYPNGTWRISGSLATQYTVELLIAGSWTTVYTLSSDGLVTVTDILLSNPSQVYSLSHDGFTDFLQSEHFAEDSINHVNIVAGDGSDHSDVALNTTHRSSDGKDHSDVVLNNTHRASDGKGHSDVVLNNTHRTSDGKGHSDVVLNNAHRISNGTDHGHIDQDVKTTASPTFAGATISDGGDIVLDTTTGTKIGTGASQKIGFYNATPVIQQSHIIDADGTLADITTKYNTLLAQLETLGLLATS